MSTQPGVLDYSQYVGIPFYAYAPERMVAIVRTWAEHTWPITLQEAFTLRDQCQWTPAPDDGRFFSTPVSNGEEDGTIRRETRNKNLTSAINAQMTTRVPIELEPQVSDTVESIYTTYRDALSAIYGPPKEDYTKNGPFSNWVLPSNASIHLPSLGTLVEDTINSPAETEAAALGIYYENKYGPDLI